MELAPEQDKALLEIDKWLGSKSGDWMFTLAGYAGTGKTTLLQHLLNNSNRSFRCCAPTGKAASVLQKKLKGRIVTTVHKLLYVPSRSGDEEVEALFREKEEAERTGGDVEIIIHKIRKAQRKKTGPEFSVNDSNDITPETVIVVDEASMTGNKMLKDFQALGCKVLFVGDPGQLPPVGDKSWFIPHSHSVVLTKVHRQALDSPIIRLSMEIRENNGIIKQENYRDGLCRIISKNELEHEEWLSADQVITGSNNSRRRINRFFRNKLGRAHSPVPLEGEKMICLKNDYKPDPIHINGEQFRVTRSAEDSHNPDGSNIFSISYNGRESEDVEFYDYHTRLHYDPSLIELPYRDRQGMMECDYAYGITVHKSQGSEWDNVIVADDGMKKEDRNFRKRWFYTAVTRAKERLTIVK